VRGRGRARAGACRRRDARHTSTRERRARDADGRVLFGDRARGWCEEVYFGARRALGRDRLKMGVDELGVDDAHARRATTTSTSERRTTVMMSVAVMAMSSLMTLGIKRGVEGRGSLAATTPFKAALGQRSHATWTENNQKTNDGNAADDGFVSLEQQRDFEGREWAWEGKITCDNHKALDFDVDAVDAGRKALWRNASFSFQFWRTPRSRHYQLYEQENIRNAFCKAGQYQVNIVTMMDDASSCEFARAHYDKGAEQFPTDKNQHLGQGTFYCHVRSLSNSWYKLMPMCGARTTLEFNRVQNLGDSVRLAKDVAGYKFLNAYYCDPEDFEISLISHRIFDPNLNRAFPAQFRVGCYKDGAARRANNCQEGTAYEPRRVISTRLMGGTVDAIAKMNNAIGFLTRRWVPLRDRGQYWTLDDNGLVAMKPGMRAKGCVCPTDEEALTQLAHEDPFKHYFAFEENADPTIGVAKQNEYGTCHWVDFGLTDEKRKLVD